jgi:hypothetical protein
MFTRVTPADDAKSSSAAIHRQRRSRAGRSPRGRDSRVVQLDHDDSRNAGPMVTSRTTFVPAIGVRANRIGAIVWSPG